jgi:hypothetical protein
MTSKSDGNEKVRPLAAALFEGRQRIPAGLRALGEPDSPRRR